MNSEVNLKIKEINQLKEKINEISKFIDTVNVTEKGKVHTKLKLITTTETVKSIVFFGKRDFYIGSHEHSVEVPLTILEDVVYWAKSKRSELEDKLNGLIT